MLAILAAGLPNILGSFQETANRMYFNGNYTGALKAMNYDRSTLQGTEGGNGDGGFIFDASLSNTIYGKSDTVQPPALQLIPQIRY